MKRKSGFTLVEIMIVVLIIGLLAALAVPTFVRARDRTRMNTCINNLRQMESAIQQWAMEDGDNTNPNTGMAPADWEAFIRGGIPECPSGGDYTIPGSVDDPPTCSEDDHLLPEAGD